MSVVIARDVIISLKISDGRRAEERVNGPEVLADSAKPEGLQSAPVEVTVWCLFTTCAEKVGTVLVANLSAVARPRVPILAMWAACSLLGVRWCSPCRAKIVTELAAGSRQLFAVSPGPLCPYLSLPPPLSLVLCTYGYSPPYLPWTAPQS